MRTRRSFGQAEDLEALTPSDDPFAEGAPAAAAADAPEPPGQGHPRQRIRARTLAATAALVAAAVFATVALAPHRARHTARRGSAPGAIVSGAVSASANGPGCPDLSSEVAEVIALQAVFQQALWAATPEDRLALLLQGLSGL